MGATSTCIVGGHEFNDAYALEVDASVICYPHAIQIANTVDNRSLYETVDARILDVMRRNRALEKRAAAEAEAKRRRGSRHPGFVYYLRIDDLIKIGYAADLGKRTKAYPPNAELLAAHPGTMEMEKNLHSQFRAHLRRGREWFAPHREVLEHVDAVRMRFGDFSRFVHRYRKSG